MILYASIARKQLKQSKHCSITPTDTPCFSVIIVIFLLYFDHGRQLGGLVVKSLACYAGGPGYDPRVENTQFSKDLHQ